MGLLNQILNLANSQLGKTRNDFLSDNPPQEWCAWFITWLAKKTNCTSIPQSISCTEMSNMFIRNNAFAKYPDDVIKVIEQVKSENSKTVFFNKWAFVGSDIGASTAVMAAEKIS